MGACEATDRGRVHDETQTARDLAGGKTVTGWRHRAEKLAQKRLDRRRPGPGVIAPRSARHPAALRARSAGAEIVGVELVKAGAPEFESLGTRRGGEIASAKGGEDFADQRSTEAKRELLIEFFTPRTMTERRAGREARSAWGRSEEHTSELQSPC